MDHTWSKYLSEILGESVTKLNAVHGGDISEAYCITTVRSQYFLKVNARSFLSNFQCEANALNFLKHKSSLAIPDVISLDSYRDHAYLILRSIESTRPNSIFWHNLGIGLAELHQNYAPEFGHFEDNYIGSLSQKNTSAPTWNSFYEDYRLRPLFKKGFDQGLFNQKDSRNLEDLIKNLPAICPDEPASLIHGDLWSGNMLCNRQIAYLIDPSVSYAHREMDIAMTKLFGGFDPIFYSAYQEIYPLEPNFESRREIYQLYYLLVHAILFKGGYTQKVKSILSKFG